MPSNNFLSGFQQFKSARYAWQSILEWYVVTSQKKCVLLPSYIGCTARDGSGVFDPIKATGVSYDFYPVHADLSISIDIIRNRLEFGDVGMILVVHWFGFSHVDMCELRSLCDNYNVVLVEDCAHVLMQQNSNKGLGDYGDFAFFSIHKTFGGDTGGALRINGDFKTEFFNYNAKFALDCPNLAMMLLSADAHKISEHRRTAYKMYFESFEKNSNLQILHPAFRVDPYIPQSFPILVNPNFREQIYFSLISKGVPVTSLYYKMIPEISQNFQDSHLVSSSILNFPVHHGCSLSVLPLIIERIKFTFHEIFH